MYFSEMTRAELEKELSGLQKEYDELAKEGLSLDLSRGKPGAKQLDLLQGMLDCISSSSDCTTENGFASGIPSRTP